MQVNLFLPQMRMSYEQLVARARVAEAAGFVGITGMDHLSPPMADGQPMYEAIVTTTWLAAHTVHINVGSLVLCDAFRLPALLAKQAVSIDHASGGRFEAGDARVSIQQMVAFVPEGADRSEVEAQAHRRFGYASPLIGTGPELVDAYGRLAEQGVERVYAWFCDFAPPDTIAEFGETVIAALR